MEHVALSRQPEIRTHRVGGNESPVLQATVDLAAELEEVLAVDLNALDVSGLPTRRLGIDHDQLRRSIAPAGEIAKSPPQIEIAVDFDRSGASANRIPRLFGIGNLDPETFGSTLDLAVAILGAEDVPRVTELRGRNRRERPRESCRRAPSWRSNRWAASLRPLFLQWLAQEWSEGPTLHHRKRPPEGAGLRHE